MKEFRQNKTIEELTKKIERLPQPMSKEFFERCKKAIIENSPLGVISRTKLCEICFFLSRNTLRNLDCDKTRVGIKNPQHIGNRQYVYYNTEDVLEYIEYEFCIKPQQRIDRARKELEKHKEELKLKDKRTANYYKTGELKCQMTHQ